MKLLLNGKALPTFLLSQFFGVLGEKSFFLPASGFYLFENIKRGKDLNALLPLCFNLGFNWAFLKEGRNFSSFQLMAFDMDSTLISVECIDELADCAGKKKEVSQITERAMRGEMDYASSLKERLKCLEGLDSKVLSHVYEERVFLQEGVENLLKVIHQHKMRSIILSGGFTYFTERLRIEEGFDFATSNKLEIVGGKLTGRVVGEIVDSAKKRFYLEKYLEENQIAQENAIAVGDGANDLPMLQFAGLSVAFHSKESIRYQTDVAINFGGMDLLPQFLSFA